MSKKSILAVLVLILAAGGIYYFSKDKIVNIVQSGYMSNDKLLRPAMVVVSSGSEN